MDSRQAAFEYLRGVDYDSLTASIYGAAAGSNDWRDACERIARRFRLANFQIASLRKSDGAIVMLQEGGSRNPGARFDHLSRFHPKNPFVGPMLNLRGNGWLHAQQALGDARLERDPYYRDFMAGYGARWMCATRVLEDPVHDTFIGVTRDSASPPFAPGELAALEVLRNHIRNALRFEREVVELQRRPADYRAMISAMPHAVALIEPTGQVEFGNRAWRRLVSVGDPIRAIGPRMRFTDDADQACFGRALLRLFPASPEVGERPGAVFDRVVWRIGERGSPREHLVIALSLAASRSGEVFGASDKMLLIVHPLRALPVVDPFLLAHAFDLTAAEAQVAVAMVEGARPEDIARRRNVAVQTVRTQLRAVYAKLDVSHQADLVRVLAALPILDGGARASVW
ncbi:MAG: helix-turn-helix transcriptional regulator [Lautropia sp.]